MQFLNGNTEYGLSIYHEVNWCADNLANLGCEPSEKVIECLFTSFNQRVNSHFGPWKWHSLS
jgi:hypothetical protein